MKEIVVPLPPEIELAAICAMLDGQDPSRVEIDDVETLLSAATTLRQSILAAAFRGNLVP